MIAFVHIPKAAGSTIKFVLRNSFCLRHCDVRSSYPDGIFRADELALARRVYPGLRSISGHALVAPTEHLPDDVRCFTFLREPLRRTVSDYQHHLRGGRRARHGRPTLSLEAYFDTWSNGPLRNRQVFHLAGAEDLDKAKAALERYMFVGLVERFDESLDAFARLCPYPVDVRYVVKNRAPPGAGKRGLLDDPAARAQIEAANALDLELYAYARDVLYPAQLERARATAPPRRWRGPPWLSDARARAARTYNNVFYRTFLIKLDRRLGRRGAARAALPAPAER